MMEQGGPMDGRFGNPFAPQETRRDSEQSPVRD